MTSNRRKSRNTGREYRAGRREAACSLDDLQISIAAMPYLLSVAARKNNASSRGATRTSPALAVDQKAGAAERGRSRHRRETQRVRAGVRMLERRSADRPSAARNGARVRNVLKERIVFCTAVACISDCDERTVDVMASESAAALAINPCHICAVFLLKKAIIGPDL